MRVALVHIGCGRWATQVGTLFDALAKLRNVDFDEGICVNDVVHRGGAWAIRQAWAHIADTEADYVFHLEDDWFFPDLVDVDDMLSILRAYEDIAQVVLRRNAVGGEGEEGYIGDRRNRFHSRESGRFLVHSEGFWLNPCVYRASICRDYEWPEHGSEGDFTPLLLADGWKFAVYGDKGDDPRCIHTGERVGGWRW